MATDTKRHVLREMFTCIRTELKVDKELMALLYENYSVTMEQKNAVNKMDETSYEERAEYVLDRLVSGGRRGVTEKFCSALESSASVANKELAVKIREYRDMNDIGSEPGSSLSSANVSRSASLSSGADSTRHTPETLSRRSRTASRRSRADTTVSTVKEVMTPLERSIDQLSAACPQGTQALASGPNVKNARQAFTLNLISTTQREARLPSTYMAAQSQRHVLQALFSDLRDSLFVDEDLYDNLYANGVISKEQRQDLEKLEAGDVGSRKRAKCLLDMLAGCSSDTVELLCGVLKQSRRKRNKMAAWKIESHDKWEKWAGKNKIQAPAPIFVSDRRKWRNVIEESAYKNFKSNSMKNNATTDSCPDIPSNYAYPISRYDTSPQGGRRSHSAEVTRCATPLPQAQHGANSGHPRRDANDTLRDMHGYPLVDQQGLDSLNEDSGRHQSRNRTNVAATDNLTDGHVTAALTTDETAIGASASAPALQHEEDVTNSAAFPPDRTLWGQPRDRAVTAAVREKSYQIGFLGNSFTGKTSVIRSLAGFDFDDRLTATTGIDSLAASVELDDNNIRLILWDTGGTEQFRPLNRCYLRKCHVFVICYDILNAQSFRDIEKWMNEAEMCCPHGFYSLLILSNKQDETDHRRVPEDIAIGKAEELQVPYMQCSAKTNWNIDQLRERLAKMGQQLAPNEINEERREDPVNIHEGLARRKRSCCWKFWKKEDVPN